MERIDAAWREESAFLRSFWTFVNQFGGRRSGLRLVVGWSETVVEEDVPVDHLQQPS